MSMLAGGVDPPFETAAGFAFAAAVEVVGSPSLSANRSASGSFLLTFGTAVAVELAVVVLFAVVEVAGLAVLEVVLDDEPVLLAAVAADLTVEFTDEVALLSSRLTPAVALFTSFWMPASSDWTAAASERAAAARS